MNASKSPADSRSIHKSSAGGDEIGLSMEAAIEEAGGYGKFQWIYCSLAGICFVPHGIFIYNLGYLTLIPVMMCPDGSGQSILCKDESQGIDIGICENGSLRPGVYPDFSYDRSLHNWITQLDLYCEPSYKASLFGALFFIGVLFSMIILAFTSKFGRRINLIVTWWITLLAVVVIVTIPNLYTRYIGMFIMGMCMIRSIESYILATEFSPSRLQIIVATAVLGFDVITLPLSSIYFKFIYDNWIVIGYIGIGVTLFVTFGAMFIPESPRFLYEEGEFDQARAIVNRMARMNKSALAEREWKFDIEESDSFDDTDKLSKKFKFNLK